MNTVSFIEKKIPKRTRLIIPRASEDRHYKTLERLRIHVMERMREEGPCRMERMALGRDTQAPRAETRHSCHATNTE